MQTISLRTPYLIFVGDESRKNYVKTGAGLVDWRPELCVGQFRLTADTADLGLPDMSIAEAVEAGVGSLVIGTAAVGGEMPAHWQTSLAAAAAAGLDIVAGLHSHLGDSAELAAAAANGGARLVDVRVPPAKLPVGSGKKRGGLRLLTVGTDCALGKKYTALQLEKDMRAAGMNADFRASGQTGIMIAGEGIALDAVVSDFLTGAAELLSPDNSPAHWDVIEGQGGLFHPAYAPVSHGLLLGSQPDAFIVCHEAGREHISGWEHYRVPSIGEVISGTIRTGSLTNPDIRCAGISVNTSTLPASERAAYLRELAARYDLPCVDPLIDGTGAIVDYLRQLHG
ncbi:DUF1611 domain-containing protein [Kineobactrum salinum]|uniref:DUF1611 domain-containing protein n=1 Tax=Kineobactrum salinum TaxID=2708301 RepID=A0A6C0U2J9_9GAMM|nr:DUF1611 domain-containing protein [Kineobactrum salinum]QIB64595.1 DUF1611 domain-containing protein [Kineobactrum salinum]